MGWNVYAFDAIFSLSYKISYMYYVYMALDVVLSIK